MGSALGLGVPGWPHVARSFDLLPLLGVILAVIVIRFGIGARLTLRTVGIAALCGTAWAYGTEAVGVAPATAAGLLLALVVASLARRAQAR